MKVFVSYSAQHSSSGNVKRFVERLEEAISNLGEKSEIHVLNDGSLSEGDNWKERLTEMLNKAEVLVALYAPLYLESEPCGKELDFFMKRIPESTAVAISIPIIPVWWQPLIERDKDGFSKLPSFGNPILNTLQNREKFSENYGKYSFDNIAKDGLEYFIKQETNSDFKPVVDKYFMELARNIKLLADQHRESLILNQQSFDEAVNVFSSIKPGANIAPSIRNRSIIGGSRVHFIVLAAHPNEIADTGISTELVDAYRENGGTDWHPFWPDDRYVGACLQGIVSRNFGNVETVLVAAKDPKAALTNAANAELRGQPLFFVIDAWSSKLKCYSDFLMELAAHNLPYCAVIVPFVSTAERPDLINDLHDLLSSREVVEDPLFQTYIATNEHELESYVADLYEKIRAKFRRRSKDNPSKLQAPFTGGSKPTLSSTSGG